MQTIENRGRLTTAADTKAFLLAGNATLTLVSEKTGMRYTFKVGAPHDVDRRVGPHFVSVMYGPDNENDFVFMGTIFRAAEYRHGKRSTLPAEDIRERAFLYAWVHLSAGRMPPHVEVWHEGRCCRCGRKLTVPESIERGIGPECYAMMASAA